MYEKRTVRQVGYLQEFTVFLFCEVNWPVQWVAEINYLQPTLSESIIKLQRIPTILSPAVKHTDIRIF